MTNKKNYETLKVDIQAPDLERWCKAYPERYVGPDNYAPELNQYSLRRSDIQSCCGIVSLQHLGYRLHVDALEYLNKGLSDAFAFFCSGWWKEVHNHSERMTIYYAKTMDKTNEEWDPDWADTFDKSLLFGLLSERWEELDQICNWVEASLDPGYFAGGTKADYEMVKIHLSVAASLRKKPMPGLEGMEQDLLDSKQKYPIMLLEAWQAARNNDQAGFEKGLIAALKRVSSKRGVKKIPIEWLAPNESIVALAAQRLGMTIPELPPKLNALLITPESIGVK